MAVELENFFDEFQGQTWVQPGGPNPANELYALFCHDVDGIDEPRGDVTRRLCRQGDGSFKIVHTTQGTPSATTFDVEAWYGKTASWLDDQVAQRCPMPYYFHHMLCGRQDAFLNYDRAKLVPSSTITNRSSSNMVRNRAEENDGPEPTGRAWSINGDIESPEYWKLVETEIDLLDGATTQLGPLRDIYMDSDRHCMSNCGAEKSIGTTGAVVGENVGAVIANAWFTTNKWAVGSHTVLPGPFAASEVISACVRFPITGTTFRTLVACGTAAAAGLRVGYSDNEGVAWAAAVALNASATEMVPHGGALFALDGSHIWLGTNEGDIHFSSDGGVTWTQQTTPAPGANGINAIHFFDENNGAAVGGATGASEFKLITTDGGLHWAAMTGVAQAAVMATGVVMLSTQHIQTTWEDGDLWYSLDGGAVWAQKTLPKAMVKASDIMYIDQHMGAIVGVDSADKAVMERTFTGGAEWEHFTHATAFASVANYGLNAVWVVDYNTIYAVGDLVGTEALVLTWQRYG
jgi:photosystem II stability/assembly factor-like uncharacterized protein